MQKIKEFHVVARLGIETIQDLEGKKVGFGPSTSGAFMTSSVIFDRLGITVEALDLSYDQGRNSSARARSMRSSGFQAHRHAA